MSRKQHISALRDGFAKVVLAVLFMLPLLLLGQVTPADSVAPAKPSGKGNIKGNPVADTLKVPPIKKGEEMPVVANDSTKNKVSRGRKLFLYLNPKKDFYDPRKAALRSAILPGWGQIYDNRLWKVPIIYGGFAAFTVFFIGNHQGYLDYDRALKCSDTLNFCYPNPYANITQQIGVQGIYNTREQYRRFRDLQVIMAGVWYLLNVVDAYVDAHLRGFNVSEDLSLNLDPAVSLDPFRRKSMVVGASLTLSLRR